MNKLPTQDKRVRSMTILIDSRISCLASRCHGQGVVIKENPLVKLSTDRVISSIEVIESLRKVMKSGKGDFALIATHAKKRIVD